MQDTSGGGVPVPSRVSVIVILSAPEQVEWKILTQPFAAVVGDEELTLQADEDVAVRSELDGRLQGRDHSGFENRLVRT
jgi:hypothetical protein